MATIKPVTYKIYEDRQKYDNTPVKYTSFSGTDVVAHIVLPNEEAPLPLGEMQTFSYSIHRENKPVRILGRTNPRGFVRGPRTIAGSLIFTQFDSYAFYRLAQYKQLVYGTRANAQPMFPLADMLPPFDMILTYANEYGELARSKVMGMIFVDEGGTVSVEDIITEQTYTWMASGIQPITAYKPSVVRNAQLNRPNNTIGFGPR